MTDLCSTVSRGRGESISATASRVERWLLVEHRGAWGPESVPTSRMPPALVTSLARAANAGRARLVLIRRPHRRGVRSTVEGRWVYAVDSRPGAESVLSRHVADDAALLDLALPFDGDLAGWEPYDRRLWLVCTQGRHDRCCAVRGRPVAQAMLAGYPADTWECSHVGGDRFAANVVVLPDGLYLGKVEPDEAVRIADDLIAGVLPAGRVRGRSSLSLPAQAAQGFAREATGRYGVDDLLPIEQGGAGLDSWRIVLGGTEAVGGSVGVPLQVVVRYDRAGEGEARLLTCGDTEAKTAPLFRLVSWGARLTGP